MARHTIPPRSRHERSDLLTWEMQLRKEGTLPPEVQRYLLEHVAQRFIPLKTEEP